MAEQQLVDYIKKARDAGQTDDQTRNLLYKNGWTESEVREALTVLTQPQLQPQTQIQIKPQTQPQAAAQPKIESEVQPQLEPQYQPQSPEGNMPQMKTRSHWVLKFLMVLIIIVVLCGAGYFVAGQYINLPYSNFLLNFFSQNPDPQTVVNNMLTNMGNVKSSHTITQAEVNATDNSTKASQGKLIFNTNSETDITDIKNPKADGNFTVNLTIPGFSSPINVTVSMALVGNAFYFKLSNAAIPSAFSYPGLDISQIKGKWFKIDQDSINTLLKAGGGQVATLNVSQTNNSELAKKIQDLVSAENMFSVDKQLNSEVIGGQNTYHYSVIISKEKLKDLITKIITLEMQEAAKSQAGGSTDNSNSTLVANMVQAGVKTFMDAVGDINVEMWIGQKDYMLYQIKVDKAIDLSKISSSINTQLEIKLTETNSNFNKPITVQVPVDAQKIESIVLPLLKPLKIESDMKQIGIIAQSVFSANKSYYSLCNRGLLNGYLNTYGKNLVDLNNDIINQSDNRSPTKKPICFSSVQDYCVSVQLADGSYLCIDKNSALGKTKCASYKTICQ